jgi:hypothetical protein
MERQLWKEHSDKVLGKKIRIRNKHPGSATLYWTINGSLTATDTIITPLFEPSTLSHSKNYNSLCLIQQTVLRHTEIYLYLEARIQIRVKSWIWIQNSILIKKESGLQLLMSKEFRHLANKNRAALWRTLKFWNPSHATVPFSKKSSPFYEMKNLFFFQYTVNSFGMYVL